MFDYDDSINLSFDAKIAGKSLVAAKHEVLTKTGDFLFLAHSERELAQRMQMVEEDIEKTAYRKLANLSDSKAKLVRVLHEEWQLRHANCEMCKVALQMPSMGTGAPAAKEPFSVVPSQAPAQNLTSKHDLGARMPQAPVAPAKPVGPSIGQGPAPTAPVAPQNRSALPTVGGPAYKAPAATPKSAPMTPAATPHSAPAPSYNTPSAAPAPFSENRGSGSNSTTPSAPMPSANAAESSMGMPKAPAAPAMPNSTIADDAANKTLPVALSSKNFDDRYENEKLRLAAPDAAKKDYDKDGKLESSEEEHAGAVDRAIKKQNGQDTDDN